MTPRERFDKLLNEVCAKPIPVALWTRLQQDWAEQNRLLAEMVAGTAQMHTIVLDVEAYAIHVVEASDTLRPGPGPYRGVVYYDPEGDPTPPALRPVPKRPSPYVFTPAAGKCQCGSGSDDLGPGHSSWCPRHAG